MQLWSWALRGADVCALYARLFYRAHFCLTRLTKLSRSCHDSPWQVVVSSRCDLCTFISGTEGIQDGARGVRIMQQAATAPLCHREHSVLHGENSKRLASPRNTEDRKHLQSTQSAQPTHLTDQAPSTTFESSDGPGCRRCQCPCGYGYVIIHTTERTAQETHNTN